MLSFEFDGTVELMILLQALPKWIESLRSRLRDHDGTHRNVKLFLLRLILNCQKVFEPFAKFILVDILDVISRQDLWPSEVIILI